ncbi:hypothetical protein DL764_010249 [Monosporascus ibericus]|uniref:Uncharacterized protein n=1 Tax=Monosporascus ibericus TaxID=155417 RepID=A0A4Q4SVQ2_9PEZI|nr:hypothetical protein DL764_010249 [Monosporascus ibericus]
MATTANLDRMAFRSPPLAVGQEGVGQTENLRGPLDHPSEPSFRQADEGHLSVCHGHTPDEPIWIPSDAESDVDDSDDSNDRLDTDDSQSDDTLPSANTLVTTSKVLSTIADKDSLSNVYENAEDDCRLTIEQHRSDFAADTQASAVQCMPPAANTPQGDRASQDDAAGSTSHADFIPTASSTADPNPVPTISEACRSRQSSPSSPEDRGGGMKDRGSRSAESSSSRLMNETVRRRLHSRGVTIERCTPDSSRHNSNSDVDGDTRTESAPSSDSSLSSDGYIHGDQESYCPSLGGDESGPVDGQGHDTDGSEQPPRKRRKPSLAGNRRRRHGAPSHPLVNIANLPACSMRSVPLSHRSSESGDIEAMAAKFEEWPLQDATLKRVFVNGEAIFQLQFGWHPLANNLPACRTSRNGRRTPATRRKDGAKRNSVTSPAFAPEEDDLLVKLKERPGSSHMARNPLAIQSCLSGASVPRKPPGALLYKVEEPRSMGFLRSRP